jgi:hypothetical protein
LMGRLEKAQIISSFLKSKLFWNLALFPCG